VLAALSFTACKKENATVETTDAIETATQTADAVTYTTNVTDSKIDWVGGKVSGDQHTGTISLKDGEVFVTDNVVTGGKFTIDMKYKNVTDNTDGKKKDRIEKQLKRATRKNAEHLYNVKKFPNAILKITSF